MEPTALKIIFWTGFLVVFYAYVGYGVILFAVIKIKRFLFGNKTDIPPEYFPEITFIVCAYNEQAWIESKIANSIAVSYPANKIRFLWVTDGSSDNTPALAESYPYPPGVQWAVLHEAERRGKIAAFQRAMKHVQTPIVVSTDANTMINREAIVRMARLFIDPSIGAVAGEKRIFMAEKDDAGSAGEGIYWTYESLLKKWDAELWSVVGAAGELFAFRTDVYEDVPADTIVEDFVLTMRIAQKGYRVAYAPDAYAVESSSASVGEEIKRKIRIAAGGIQAVVRLAPLLNIFRYGVLSFQYISHRVLRWTIAPAFLPILLVVNVMLACQHLPLYQFILALQITFYGMALAGYFLEQRKLKVKAFFIPYYFCVMNVAMYAGLLRYLRGNQSVLWEKAKRAGEK